MTARFPLFLTAAILVLGLQGSAVSAPAAGYVGSYRWTMDDPLFGGFSALHLDADGLGFLAITDRGSFARGQLIRDAAGAVTGVMAGPVTRLSNHQGAPLAPGRTDSEGLAVAPDGTVFVSFEGPARVLRYDRIDGRADNLPSHPDFARMQRNSAIEALAIGPDGTLYTLPERSGRETRPFPIYRFRTGQWDQPFDLPRRGEFLPVSADVGPDGRLYVLERAFHGLSGFAMRLRRFDISDRALTDEVSLLETRPGQHGNLEGLSVWRDGLGLRATMITDDGFSIFFSTEIVDYRLPD